MPPSDYDMHAIRNALAIAHGHTWLAWNALTQEKYDSEVLTSRLTAALDAMDRMSKLVNKSPSQENP